MDRLLALIRTVAYLVKTRQMYAILQKIQRRLYSDRLSYGLRRDLTVPLETPEARIPIHVRPLQERDMDVLFGTQNPETTGEGTRERVHRRMFLDAGLPTCYVAVTDEDVPCYMQWLIGASHNESMQRLFDGIFPRLAPDEALLENAFTLEPFRGQRIMPCAMAQIAEKAGTFGARWVITFVAHDNIPSLKGCKRAGFAPYMMRRERWVCFRRTLTFTPLPEGTPYPFDRESVPVSVPESAPAHAVKAVQEV